MGVRRTKTYNAEFLPAEQLQAWLAEVLLYRETDGKEGRGASRIEYEELGDGASHGRNLTHAFKARFRIDIESEHPMIVENRRLTARVAELEDEGATLRGALTMAPVHHQQHSDNFYNALRQWQFPQSDPPPPTAPR